MGHRSDGLAYSFLFRPGWDRPDILASCNARRLAKMHTLQQQLHTIFSRRKRTHAPVDRHTCARAHNHFRPSCTLTRLGRLAQVPSVEMALPTWQRGRFLRRCAVVVEYDRWARLCALMCVDACRAERCGPKPWLEWLPAAYFSSRLPSATYRNSSASLRSAHCGSASSSFSSLARPLSMVRAPRSLHFTAGSQ